MDHDVEVAVVGGGLGGLSLAISLLRAGVDVRVFEQAGRLREIGAGVAIAANAVRLVQRLGVELGTVATVPPALEFRRWDTGDPIWSHEIGSWYERRMGAPMYLLHRGTLQRMLAAQVPPERVHPGHQVTRIVEEPGRVRLRFADQPDVLARIVVGFDGMHSTVRRYVAGHVVPRYSGEIGFRGIIPTARCPSLPTPTAMNVWCGPGTHVIYYGVDDGQLVNFLAVSVPDRLPGWTRTTNRRPATRADALEVLADHGWDPRIRRLISHIEGDMHFWALQELPPLARWARERVVLAGDAAHAPLPHQGQGAGQAIEDAYVLGHLLAQTGTEHYHHIFDTYQRLRRQRARRVQHYSRLSGRLIKLAGPAASKRDQALPGLPRRIAWIHQHRADDTVLNAVADGPGPSIGNRR